MPLGTEVGLGPGDIVLDGDQLPPPQRKGTQHPRAHFSAHVYYGKTVDHLSTLLSSCNDTRQCAVTRGPNDAECCRTQDTYDVGFLGRVSHGSAGY